MIQPISSRISPSSPAGPILLQRYVPEVAARGEWSLIHLGGTFSQAVLKTPESLTAALEDS